MRIEELLAAVVSIGFGAAAQVLLKIGATHIAQDLRGSGPFGFILSIVTTWQLMLGLFFYGLSALVWIHLLSTVNLSLAYPLVGLSFVTVILIGVFALGESVTLVQAVGCVVILIGIMMVVRGQAG
jgi:drug/metabolite transporter (DMT)-like permease